MGNTKRERKNRKFKFNVNKKRVNKKQHRTGTAAVSVWVPHLQGYDHAGCYELIQNLWLFFLYSPIVKHAWEDSKTIRENLTSMGLAYDANVTLKIPTAKVCGLPFDYVFYNQ